MISLMYDVRDFVDLCSVLALFNKHGVMSELLDGESPSKDHTTVDFLPEDLDLTWNGEEKMAADSNQNILNECSTSVSHGTSSDKSGSMETVQDKGYTSETSDRHLLPIISVTFPNEIDDKLVSGKY
jgi:hypothetical protein